jgi:hypothetical protein
MLESVYQAQLIKELYRRFPDCIVLKNDTDYLQGIPDLTILYRGTWAALEVKARENAPQRPNQEYYVSMLKNMSYSSFIYPENEKAVLDELEAVFARAPQRRRKARVPKP